MKRIDWPPLPPLTEMSREQLIDCIHRLDVALKGTTEMVNTMNELIDRLQSGRSGSPDR